MYPVLFLVKEKNLFNFKNTKKITKNISRRTTSLLFIPYKKSFDLSRSRWPSSPVIWIPIYFTLVFSSLFLYFHCVSINLGTYNYGRSECDSLSENIQDRYGRDIISLVESEEVHTEVQLENCSRERNAHIHSSSYLFINFGIITFILHTQIYFHEKHSKVSEVLNVPLNIFLNLNYNMFWFVFSI